VAPAHRGLLLIWIAYKLLVQEEGGHEVKAGNTLWQSVWTNSARNRRAAALQEKSREPH